jgi:hypothetical protein
MPRRATRGLARRERLESRAAVRTATDRRSLPCCPACARPETSPANPLVPRGCTGRLKKGSRPLAAMRPAPPCPPELAVSIWRPPLPHLATVNSAVSSAPNPRLPTPLKRATPPPCCSGRGLAGGELQARTARLCRGAPCRPPFRHQPSAQTESP